MTLKKGGCGQGRLRVYGVVETWARPALSWCCPQREPFPVITQALGPRAVPKPEAVATELRRLALENGEDPQSEDADYYQTSLANNPSDYFGMVG